MAIHHETSYRSSTPHAQVALALEDKFEILKDDIGDGSFGSVALARVRTAGAHIARRGTTVAIKTMKKTFDSFGPCLELREVVFLRTLPNHTHLVPALDIFLDPYSKKLHICMEHMDGNLYQLMKARDHKCLDTTSVKSILVQILSGLEHIHAHHFFHRDIKPENILVSTSATNDPLAPIRRPSTVQTPPATPPIYTVKIADFGLARETHSKLPYTTYVSTRWYRAPEVLLRAGHYSAPVDIWALGAMAVEVATLKPLFPGSNEVDQVWRVCEIMGSPGNWYSRAGGKVGGGDWPDGTKLAQQLGFSFPKMAPHSIETILQPSHWPPSLSDFVTWCLMWDPKNRPTSTQALNHHYFDDAFDPLRPKSSASRLLNHKSSDLNRKVKDSPEGPRSLSSKPSWFRRSFAGREVLAQASQPSSERKAESPRPTAAPSPLPQPVPAKARSRVQPEKRFTWASGPTASNTAPMPILPTIRPISPLSDAVTARASARQSRGTPLLIDRDGDRRRPPLEDKSIKKLGRQLSVASNGNHYADAVRQETERALNGQSGLVSPPNGQRESFFSHLRKRARRLSGRNQLSSGPEDGDLEANAGCGPWASHRSSMAVDLTSATLLNFESVDPRDPEGGLQSTRYSVDLPSPVGYGSSGKTRVSVAGEGSAQRTPQDSAARTLEAELGSAPGPISSRTRRALQRSSHPVQRYETPDEQEELVNEMIHTGGSRVDLNHSMENEKNRKESRLRPTRQPLRDIDRSNPYPTPSPSGKKETDYFGRMDSSPIPISKAASYYSNRVETKFPTPPYEENEWAAAAAASIYAAGAAYR